MLSPFLFAVEIDVVTEFARESVLSELLYGNDLVLMSEIIEGLRKEFFEWKEAFERKLALKWVVYRNYVRPAILYGSEAWCLKESEMGILRKTERSMVRAMCGVQLKDR